MADSNKKKSSFKKFLEITKIRCQLLRLWFLKNLSVIIKTILLVIFILVMVNVIDGRDFLPLFGMKTEDVENIDWNTFDGIKNLLATLFSAGFSAYVFLRKTKSLAIEDIKSKELKIALIKARLYFNENGKLCKRLEETAQIDLDGDGKVSDTPISEVQDENLVTGIPRAIGELATVLTTKIDVDDETTIVEEAQLDDPLPQEEQTNIEEKLYSEEVGAPATDEMAEGDLTLDEKIDELKVEGLIKDTEETVAETVTTTKKKHRSFIKEFIRAFRLAKNPELKDGFNNRLEKTKKKEEVTEEVKDEKPIVDNIEIVETPVVEEVTEVKEPIAEPVIEEVTSTPVVEEQTNSEETTKEIQVEIKTVTIKESTNKNTSSTSNKPKTQYDDILEQMKKNRNR